MNLKSPTVVFPAAVVRFLQEILLGHCNAEMLYIYLIILISENS